MVCKYALKIVGEKYYAVKVPRGKEGCLEVLKSIKKDITNKKPIRVLIGVFSVLELPLLLPLGYFGLIGYQISGGKNVE